MSRKKTIQQQIAEGDPAKRGVHTLDRALERIPKGQRGMGAAPAHFTGTQRQVWDHFREQLEIMELDCAADRHLLEGLCTAYVRAVEADLQLERDGCEVNDPIVDKFTGAIKAYRTRNSPAVARSNQAWKMVTMLSGELGLSLMARQRVSTESADHGMTDIMKLLTQPYEKKDPTCQ